MPFARKRREQFVLPVAGNAGDAEDFAAAQFERDILQPHAVGIVGLKQRSLTTRRGTVIFRAGGRFDFLDLGADHHPRQRSRGLLLRIAGRDLLAAAQDRGGVAKPLHLVELVADVEDRAALGLQPVQHDEELIGFLRGQDRGRLIEDQEFRVLHQHAHDLDALPLADRELPDLAVGIERKPVNIGHFFEPRRHVLEQFLAVEPERDILGDGEIVEQREMLEHHADAAGTRFRRSGQDHLLALPAHLAFARLDQAVDGFDQGRFARAVFAQQRMDFLRPDIDIDGIIGEESAVALGQPNWFAKAAFRRNVG